MIICGVEEAGRGPVIGPLVMAAVNIDSEKEFLLKEIGVKDSKLLSPKQREELFPRVKELALSFEIIILTNKDVDDALRSEDLNLNWLEAITSVRLINALKPQKAILDCPSNNISAYANYVKERLDDKGLEILAEHKADVNYPVVSAASILAKVTRDRLIEDIKKKIGIDFGSGYPSDPKTKEFLANYYDKYDIFRKTWASYKRVSQTSLDRFQ